MKTHKERLFSSLDIRATTTKAVIRQRWLKFPNKDEHLDRQFQKIMGINGFKNEGIILIYICISASLYIYFSDTVATLKSSYLPVDFSTGVYFFFFIHTHECIGRGLYSLSPACYGIL
jgi:hypothetical protein